MPVENLATLARAVSALNVGDVEAWLRGFHPDAEWVSTARWAALDSPLYRGHDQLRRFATTQREAFPNLRYEVDAAALGGRTVLTNARWAGKGTSSGLELDLRIFHAFEFDGDKIRRVRGFEEEADARAATEIDAPWQPVEAAGLSG